MRVLHCFLRGHRLGLLLGLFVAGYSVTASAQLPVTDGLMLWLDASDASTIFSGLDGTTPADPGDRVTTWADKSGNGYDATVTDLALRPIWDATAMNGQPALHFDGTVGEGMIIDDALVVTRPYSVFIVNQYTGDVRGRTLQARNGPNWLHGLWGGAVSSYADGFVGSNPAAEVGFAYIADTTGTPAGDSTLFVNGLDFTTNSAPVGAPGNLGLMSGGTFPAEVSDADVSEIVVYNRVLTQMELDSVRGFLYDKYNATILLPPAEQNTVLGGTIGTFTGGDAGEGLDLDGQFVYAIDVGGPGGVQVRDAVFTDGTIAGMEGGASAGATINVANEIPNWHAPAYGDSSNDDALEAAMASIRWTAAPAGTSVDLAVEPGKEYKLQLMFAENCCDRGFDISVEGELLVDNFNIPLTQGDGDIGAGIGNTAQGAVFSTTFVAGDDLLNILLGPPNQRAPDNNATLSAVTLEVVPEPGSALLALCGCLGLLRLRRR